MATEYEGRFLIGANLTIGELKERLDRNGIPFLEPHTTPVRRVRRARCVEDPVYNKTKGKCWYCGKPFGTEWEDHPTTDHVTPKSLGGTNTINNLVPACRKCNGLKRDMNIEDFRALLTGGKPFYGEVKDFKES